MNLLMAVVEKRLSLSLSSCDAYVNIAGGIRISEPAADLGIVLSLVSSLEDRPIDPSLTCFGEVGLSGEVRSASFAAKRVAEAKKLGFSTCILPKASLKGMKNAEGMKLIGVSHIGEAVAAIRGTDQGPIFAG